MSNLMKVERVRDSITKTAKLLTRDSVEIRLRGDGASVAYNPDGSVSHVNLPNVPENPSPEFLDAIQGFLDHEVAHILFTNHVAAMTLIKGAVAEGLKADQVKMFANVFEDIRIERNMKGQFKGSTYNLSKTLDYIIERSVVASVKSASAIEDPQKRTMQRILAGFVMYARSLDGDTTCEAFIAEHGLMLDYIPVGLLFPTLKERINKLETTEDAVQLAIDFVRAMKEASEPGEGESDESDDSAEEGEKSDMPKLGSKDDGLNDDDDDADEGDDGDDDWDDDDDDWDDEEEGDDADGEGDDGDDAEGDESDDDGKVGGEEQDDTDKEGKGKGEPDEGDKDAGEDGDDQDGKGDGPDGDDESDEKAEEEKEDEEGGGKRKGKTLKEAMKLLMPQQRNLLFDYNNRKRSVDRIAEKRGLSPDQVQSGLLDARRELKRIMKGE